MYVWQNQSEEANYPTSELTGAELTRFYLPHVTYLHIPNFILNRIMIKSKDLIHLIVNLCTVAGTYVKHGVVHKCFVQ